MPQDTQNDWLKLSDFVRKITEQKARQAAAKEARERAKAEACERSQFRPVGMAPPKPVIHSF